MRDRADGSVDLILADPPYDIGVCNVHWDTVPNYMAFAESWLSESVRILRQGGALLVYGSPCRTWMARMTVFLVDELGMQYVQDLPWVYTQGGDARMDTMNEYAVRHERLVWFEKPITDTRLHRRVFNATAGAEHYTDADRAVALSKGKGRVTDQSLDKGRPPRTYIDIPRENSKSRERVYGKHPCMKPLTLCERLINVHTNRGDLVVVPFAGSGSEMVVAAKLGRRVIGYEIESNYVELIKCRFEGHGCALVVSNVSSFVSKK